MTKNCIISLIFVIFVCFYSTSFAGQTPKYVGAKKCKTCHSDQFRIWSKSPHAKTYEILGSEEAKPIAKQYKVTGDFHEAAACQKCHVTGYGKADSYFTKSYNPMEGITCEKCHGPGSLYRKAMFIDEEEYEADPKTTVAEWAKLGLVKPDETLCRSCHGNEFNFAEKFKKIAHPRSH